MCDQSAFILTGSSTMTMLRRASSLPPASPDLAARASAVALVVVVQRGSRSCRLVSVPPPLRQRPRLVTPRVALGPDPACSLSRLTLRRPCLVTPLALPHHLVPTSPRSSPLWPRHYRPCAPTSACRCLWHTSAFSAIRHSQARPHLVLAGVTIRQHPHPEWVSKYSVYMCVI
jgi:hypothetical protein